ncbi:MAG: sigE 24 [Phycisphaerales bacterium]|nr:sigE 24 [Phycisphaerales bacterium]
MLAAHKQLLALLTLVASSTFTYAQNQPPRPADPRGTAPTAQERRADVMGRVTTVSPDGRTITITAPPPRPAGDQPAARPEPATVTLSDRTQLLFFGVAEGEAKPAPGQMAMVWLEDGSKDQAARVRLMKREGEDRPDVQGRVLAVSPDARTITIETRGDASDKPTGKIDLHIAPYTQSLYYGVDKDAARPTPDYQVVAWLEKGSRDVPTRIRFMKNDGRDLPSAPLPPR